jgi:hypothetical protein
MLPRLEFGTFIGLSRGPVHAKDQRHESLASKSKAGTLLSEIVGNLRPRFVTTAVCLLGGAFLDLPVSPLASPALDIDTALSELKRGRVKRSASQPSGCPKGRFDKRSHPRG